MNRAELKEILDRADVDPRTYSLRGGQHNDTLCISIENARWVVYYTERGARFDETWFDTESEACEHLLRRLLPPADPTPDPSHP